MDTGLLKVLLPQIPSLASTSVLYGLGRTPTASKWDLRTTLTVQVLRSLMNPDGGRRSSMSKLQATTTKDLPIKGKMWIAKTTLPAPASEDESLREKVWEAIEQLKPGGAGELQYTRPPLVNVEVEWTGFRGAAGKDEPLPQISEQEKYARMMAEPTRTSETTVLYFHGGAYVSLDPASHRELTSRLAKQSNGRVCSVRYRLSPQTAFPGQLLDALLVYLSLLYPPPGALHEAVPANHIVLGGDSAGGNLSFALLQLLLQFHRTSANPTVRFHGKDVALPLPAGVTSSSPWLDICQCLPSITANATYDYLPPQKDSSIFDFPYDAVWPADPPRGNFFCDLSLIDHPLVSPLAAQSWEGAPPFLMSAGTECLADEIRCVASRAAKQGVKVQYEDYDSMPHCFAMLLLTLPAAKRSLRTWGEFCKKCVDAPETVTTNGVFVHAKTGKEDVVDVGSMECVSAEEARRLMTETKARRMKLFEERGGEMKVKAAL